MGYVCEISQGPVATVEIFWDPEVGKKHCLLCSSHLVSDMFGFEKAKQ